MYDKPDPGIPTVVFIPLPLMLVVAPFGPIDVLTPLLLILIARPGAMRIRFLNLKPIGISCSQKY
nr:MAG TPA_asm: hypothetical protein [Caudoviricetes sp.]